MGILSRVKGMGFKVLKSHTSGSSREAQGFDWDPPELLAFTYASPMLAQHSCSCKPKESTICAFLLPHGPCTLTTFWPLGLGLELFV